MLGKLLILGCIVVRTYQFCPPSCVCNNNLLSVQCTATAQSNSLASGNPQQYHGYLNEIPIFLNPQIQSLNMHGNQIAGVSQSLQFYIQLEYLDLSLNRIVDLGSSNFESLKKLVYLNVSHNHIQSLGEYSFTGLVSLMNLDLSQNSIETIDYNVFKNLANLQYIKLDYNRLEFIDWSILFGLINLQQLTLTHNYIKTIERLFINNYYWTLDNLVELNFNFNQITKLDETSFDLFTNIKTLHACCNKINRLADNTFSNNIHLSHVDLSQNRISLIPTHFLSKLTELKSIDLSFNHLQVISSHNFNNLFKLEFIDVSSNPISYIEGNALMDNINLVTFHGNHLQPLGNLSISLLFNKPFLQSFSLQYCNLSFIDFHNHYDLIQKFDLTGNPWNCNCSTLSIHNYIASSSGETTSSSANVETNNLSTGKGFPVASKLSSVICATPPSLQGVPLTKLSLSDFHECLSTYDSFTNTVLITAGVLVGLIVVVVVIKICLVLGLIRFKRRSRPCHGQEEDNGRVIGGGVGYGHDHSHSHSHGLGIGIGGGGGTSGRGRSGLSLKNSHNYNSDSGDMMENHRYNEEIFLNFPARNASNLTLSSQYTHVYDKQVPSVLV